MSETRDWQVNINDPLNRVENAEDIAQCVYIILTTVPGSDPLRPHFGSDLYKYLDRPMNEAQPMLIYETTTAITKWEKRIKVTKCNLISPGVDKRTIKITGEVVGTAAQISITVKI